MLNVLTVDVEDYFHPTEVKGTVDQSQWQFLPSRVQGATHRLLDLLAEHNTKATFFVLGWVACHHPKLVREIAAQGHEIGCHSFAHNLVYDLSPSEFRADTLAGVKAIEDACGFTPTAYRAPSFSITSSSFWALELLVECGFTHDSSIYPIVHDRYGISGFQRHAQTIDTPSGPIMEIPPATVSLSSTRITPVGGGGYIRLLPYRYTAAGIRRINKSEHQAACFYIHPWEMDLDQPKLASGMIARLRTYTGLRAMQSKVTRLLEEFQFSTIGAVYPLNHLVRHSETLAGSVA